MEGSALSTFISSVTGAFADFNVTNLGTVIVAGITIAIPLVLAWFAYRFITRKATGALKRGRG